MNSKDDCVFCRIRDGEIPAIKIFENEDTLVFMDSAPASRGHVLVICRNHSDNIFEISASDMAAVAETSRRVARASKRALNPDGMRISQFNGRESGQTVFHYHVHIVPVYRGQPAPAHGRDTPNPVTLEETAQLIRAALESE